MVNVETDETNKADKLSPLLEAAQKGDLDALNLCLERGDDIFQLGKAKSTALHYVAYGGE